MRYLQEQMVQTICCSTLGGARGTRRLDQLFRMQQVYRGMCWLWGMSGMWRGENKLSDSH